MGDDTETAAGAFEESGTLPSTSTIGCHVSSPADNAEHLECAVDPDEIHVASAYTSGCHASESSAADNAEHLEWAVDPGESHAEASIAVAPKLAVFTCNKCAYSFLSKRLYVRHRKNVHNEDIPNVLWCLYCDYCTTDKSNYNRHTLIHTEGKRHTCEECQKTFRRLEHLLTHRTTHTKEKEFHCPTCNLSFSRRSNLVRHERSKHRGDNTKLNACELCGRCFVREDNLSRHQIVHTGERRFSCEKCPKSFGYLSVLKRHVLKFHPLPPSP